MPTRTSGFGESERRGLLDRLRQNEDLAQRHAKELDIQFRRMAEMQVQIDQLALQVSEVRDLVLQMGAHLDMLTREPRRFGLPSPLKAPLRHRKSG